MALTSAALLDRTKLAILPSGSAQTSWCRRRRASSNVAYLSGTSLQLFSEGQIQKISNVKIWISSVDFPETFSQVTSENL